jgi:hypothetical protein
VGCTRMKRTHSKLKQVSQGSQRTHSRVVRVGCTRTKRTHSNLKQVPQGSQRTHSRVVRVGCTRTKRTHSNLKQVSQGSQRTHSRVVESVLEQREHILTFNRHGNDEVCVKRKAFQYRLLGSRKKERKKNNKVKQKKGCGKV